MTKEATQQKTDHQIMKDLVGSLRVKERELEKKLQHERDTVAELKRQLQHFERTWKDSEKTNKNMEDLK